MDGVLNCKLCTHYHHNGDQYLCDAGVYDIQVAGMAIVQVGQVECQFADIPTLIEPEEPKKRGRPATK